MKPIITAIIIVLACSTGALGGVTYHEVPTSVKPRQQAVHSSGYPVRGNWFTGPNGYMIGREAMIAHLQTGEHRGKFDPAWLNTLTNAEVQSLHSDDHQRAVKWVYVRRPQFTLSSACPNGRCPQ